MRQSPENVFRRNSHSKHQMCPKAAKKSQPKTKTLGFLVVVSKVLELLVCSNSNPNLLIFLLFLFLDVEFSFLPRKPLIFCLVLKKIGL
jgi:hypothetical protein